MCYYYSLLIKKGKTAYLFKVTEKNYLCSENKKIIFWQQRKHKTDWWRYVTGTYLKIKMPKWIKTGSPPLPKFPAFWLRILI